MVNFSSNLLKTIDLMLAFTSVTVQKYSQKFMQFQMATDDVHDKNPFVILSPLISFFARIKTYEKQALKNYLNTKVFHI